MPACARSGRTSIAYLDGALEEGSESKRDRERERGQDEYLLRV